MNTVTVYWIIAIVLSTHTSFSEIEPFGKFKTFESCERVAIRNNTEIVTEYPKLTVSWECIPTI